MANEIISRLEKKLFPGLRSSIYFMEVCHTYISNLNSLKVVLSQVNGECKDLLNLVPECSL